MSVSKWAYTPEMCDGEICVGDCDLCDKPNTMPEFEKCNNDGVKMIEKCDYIKSEDAIEELKQYFIEHDEEQDEFTRPAATLAANAIVDNMPRADVRENVRGEWIYTEEDKRQTYPIIKCSICGHYVGGEWNYCPNCGAQMMGGEA